MKQLITHLMSLFKEPSGQKHHKDNGDPVQLLEVVALTRNPNAPAYWLAFGGTYPIGVASAVTCSSGLGGGTLRVPAEEGAKFLRTDRLLASSVALAWRSPCGQAVHFLYRLNTTGTPEAANQHDTLAAYMHCCHDLTLEPPPALPLLPLSYDPDAWHNPDAEPLRLAYLREAAAEEEKAIPRPTDTPKSVPPMDSPTNEKAAPEMVMPDDFIPLPPVAEQFEPVLDDAARLAQEPAPINETTPRQSSHFYTLGELLDRPTTEVPTLIYPLLPRQGVAVLAGSSDTGKSSILRQLALAIALDESQFLGFPVQAVHHRAICVSTEDGDEAVGPLLKKQLQGQVVSGAARDRLRFVFDTQDLLAQLDRMLTECPADVVVVDALGDLYAGNLNASNEVRAFITLYSQLAIRHCCLVLFMHHTGKRTEDREPSKHNLLGSQGLEAKMRVAFELRADPHTPDLRHLCVLKGNYLPADIKAKSYVLRFDGNLTFHNTGERADFSDLIKTPPASSEERAFWDEVRELLRAQPYDKVAEQVKAQAKELGVSASKSTLQRRFPKEVLHPNIPSSRTL